MEKSFLNKISLKSLLFLIIALTTIPLIVSDTLASQEEIELLVEKLEKNIFVSIKLLLITLLFSLVLKIFLSFLNLELPKGWWIFTGIILTLIEIVIVIIFKVKNPMGILFIFPLLIGFAMGKSNIIPVPWPPFRETLNHEVEYHLWAEKIQEFPYTLFGRAIQLDPCLPYQLKIKWLNQSRYFSIKFLHSGYLSLITVLIFFGILWFTLMFYDFSPLLGITALGIVSWILGDLLGNLKKYIDSEKLKNKFIVEAHQFWEEFEDRLFNWVKTQPWVGKGFFKEEIDEREVEISLRELGLQGITNERQIKERYWELIKEYYRKEKLSPESQIEDKFKRIFYAYQILLRIYSKS
ncbi:MAG: J domain-containing protein [Thermodesulfobacteriaceae bacterium]|nr:J domain-containing protein [Thermodesulfobacteriaceae bacterium]